LANRKSNSGKQKFDTLKNNNSNNNEKNSKTNEFLCRNSIFEAQIDTDNKNKIKRKRNEFNTSNDDISHLNTSINEDSHIENHYPNHSIISSNSLNTLKNLQTESTSPIKN